MNVIVRNVLTNEESLFANDLSLEENIVSRIIIDKKQTSNLIDQDFRNKIKAEHPIQTSVSTITGREFAFCESKDLHAKYETK